MRKNSRIIKVFEKKVKNRPYTWSLLGPWLCTPSCKRRCVDSSCPNASRWRAPLSSLSPDSSPQTWGATDSQPRRRTAASWPPPQVRRLPARKHSREKETNTSAEGRNLKAVTQHAPGCRNRPNFSTGPLLDVHYGGHAKLSAEK